MTRSVAHRQPPPLAAVLLMIRSSAGPRPSAVTTGPSAPDATCTWICWPGVADGSRKRSSTITPPFLRAHQDLGRGTVRHHPERRRRRERFAQGLHHPRGVGGDRGAIGQDLRQPPGRDLVALVQALLQKRFVTRHGRHQRAQPVGAARHRRPVAGEDAVGRRAPWGLVARLTAGRRRRVGIRRPVAGAPATGAPLPGPGHPRLKAQGDEAAPRLVGRARLAVARPRGLAVEVSLREVDEPQLGQAVGLGAGGRARARIGGVAAVGDVDDRPRPVHQLQLGRGIAERPLVGGVHHVVEPVGIVGLGDGGDALPIALVLIADIVLPRELALAAQAGL